MNNQQRALNAVHTRVVELNRLRQELAHRESTLSHGEDGLDNTQERHSLLQQIADIDRRLNILLGE